MESYSDDEEEEEEEEDKMDNPMSMYNLVSILLLPVHCRVCMCVYRFFGY